MSLSLAGKRWCYYVPMTQDPKVYGGYVPSLVVADEPNHYPMLGGPQAQPWIWGPTLAEAEAICDEVNQQRGISKEEAREIVSSSIAATVRAATDAHRARRPQ